MSRRGPKIRLPKRRVEVPSHGADWEKERDIAIINEARSGNLLVIAKQNLAAWCHQESIDDAECQKLADLINYKASESAKLRAEAQLRQKAKKEKAPRTRKPKRKAAAQAFSFNTSNVPDGWREFTQSEKKDQWVNGAKYYSPDKSCWRFNPSEFARGRRGANAYPSDRIIVPIT